LKPWFNKKRPQVPSPTTRPSRYYFSKQNWLKIEPGKSSVVFLPSDLSICPKSATLMT